MEENNKKEKKALKLKIKTFADLKRFTSKQLHKIVENLRKKNKDISLEQLESEGKYFEIMKYAARQSLVRRADRNRDKQKQKIRDDSESKRDILRELKENGKINDKQYDKAVEDLSYRTAKKIYEKDLGPKNQEKPKNPKIQRAIETAGKAVKAVGKGLATGATVVAGIVAAPFVGAYKIMQSLGRGVKAIGRGAETAYLTAGKVAGNVKEQVQTANGEVNREMYEKASEEKQQEMMERAYKQADKENAKRDREAARRENLHMDSKQQTIDHEQAKKNVFERVDAQELTPEEVKEVYGEEK